MSGPRCFRRALGASSVSCQARSLVFAEPGPPDEVVRCRTYDLPRPTHSETRVRFLLSALNPADINVIEGKYPNSPATKSFLQGNRIIGNEGVAIVEETSKDGRSGLKVGDWVVVGKSQLGTWTSHANLPTRQLIQLQRRPDSKLTEAQAAMLSVNPATAYRLLKDFVKLKPDTWIVQNAANSAAGTSVVQLCKAWGVNSINVVRDREDIESLRTKLKGLGATIVLTESELKEIRRTGEGARELTGGRPVKLGLNCVSGPSTSSMVTRIMSPAATLVTYGAMSKQPFTLPSSEFIFRKIKAQGFWLSNWYEKYTDSRRKMMNELVRLCEKGRLKPADHEIVELQGDDDAVTQTAREAIRRASAGYGGKKLLFRFVE